MTLLNWATQKSLGHADSLLCRKHSMNLVWIMAVFGYYDVAPACNTVTHCARMSIYKVDTVWTGSFVTVSINSSPVKLIVSLCFSSYFYKNKNICLGWFLGIPVRGLMTCCPCASIFRNSMDFFPSKVPTTHSNETVGTMYLSSGLLRNT